MKKTFKKLLTLTLCLSVALSAMLGLFACKRNTGEDEDPNRTQLYIAAYSGGAGTEYYDVLKTNFEDYCKDMEFEDGKKGVQVMFDYDEKYTCANIFGTISSDYNEIYFATGMDQLSRYIAGNKLLDITNVVVNQQLTDFGENKNIESKLSEMQKEHYKRDGKYYSLPGGESSQGIIYDIDLFEQKQLFFKKGGCPSEFCDFTQNNNSNPVSMDKKQELYDEYNNLVCKFTGTGEKSAGADGKYGTDDDGLPATITEFEEMLKQMNRRGVKAMHWSGQYASTYTPFFYQMFHANYHGYEETKLCYTGGGTDGVETKLVTGFNTDGTPKIETKKVSMSNITDISKQAGRYYALKLMETLINGGGGYVSDYSFEGLTHIDAQDKFLVSRFRNGETPIAMMIEGFWWESEAEANRLFEYSVDEFGEEAARENRRFGVFSMPKATIDQVGEKQTLLISNSSIFANAKVAEFKIPLIELFFKYICSDDALRQYTVETGLPMAMDYELNETDFDKITNFSTQFWNIRKSADKVYSFYSTDIENSTYYESIKNIEQFSASKMANGTGTYTFFASSCHFEDVTAREYFEGLNRAFN